MQICDLNDLPRTSRKRSWPPRRPRLPQTLPRPWIYFPPCFFLCRRLIQATQFEAVAPRGRQRALPAQEGPRSTRTL